MIKRNFTIGALSDVGSVRKVNQDSILVKIGEDRYGEFGLFAIADGMGGLAAGEAASRIAIEEIAEWWQVRLEAVMPGEEDSGMAHIYQDLSLLFLEIHKKISGYSKSIGQKVGTTLSLLFIYGDQYLLKHIGDSRIYMMNPVRIQQVTLDHSWVAQQVRNGSMSLEEAGTHPKKNILTQCIGASETIEIYEAVGQVQVGDTFLLCSDGFYNTLEESEMYRLFGRNKGGLREGKLQELLKNLFDRIMAKGAPDNVSAIVIHVCEQVTRKTLFSIFKMRRKE